MTATWLRCDLLPLDVVVASDTRPLEQGGYGRQGEISPSTLAGAIKTAALEHAGIDFAANGESLSDSARVVAGKVGFGGSNPGELAFVAPLWRSVYGKLLSRVPADCWVDEKGYERQGLAPIPGTSVSNLGVRCIQFVADYEPETRLLEFEELIEYLVCGADSIGPEGPPSDLRGIERRWGHERSEEGAVVEGALFSRAVQRFTDRPSVAMQAGLSALVRGLEVDELPARAVVSLGGDGHLAELRVEKFAFGPRIEELGQAAATSILEHGAFRMVLLGAAVFERGWLPPSLGNELTLVAGAVGEPLPVSGWDYEQRMPKPL
ncbi:MAG: hypothetical protein IH936_14525, partial [Acidobacteria bacterium]|nr:hypothetical protein [Acidobacteriota bacterium]